MAHQKIRPIEIRHNVAYITLTRGYRAIVDAADVHLLVRWNWCTRVYPKTAYASRTMRVGGRTRTVCLHREIMCPPPGFHVDHINGDGLDNRRANLRLATCAENTRNRRLPRNNSSGFKGVTASRTGGRWVAQIGVNGRQTYLGSFETPEAAHAAYCEAAASKYGAFARET